MSTSPPGPLTHSGGARLRHRVSWGGGGAWQHRLCWAYPYGYLDKPLAYHFSILSVVVAGWGLAVTRWSCSGSAHRQPSLAPWFTAKEQCTEAGTGCWLALADRRQVLMVGEVACAE